MTSSTTNTPSGASTFSIGGEYRVTRLGFGAMRLPTGPGPEREAAIVVARRAVELGVTLIDTAHMYGWGANEELLAEALHPYPDDLLITTKVGVTQSGTEGWAYDARPESLREQVEQGLRRLRTERVGLLQLHRIDPKVPVAEQVGALRELQLEGKIGHIGLSEVTTAQLAEARQTAGIASVQNRYNLLDREYEPVLEACEAVGIAFLPWRPVAAAASSGQASALATVATVRDRLGGNEVHRGQLRQLRTCADVPGITIQVLPLGLTDHAGLSGPFVLVETPDHEHLAYAETQRGSHLVHDPDEVSILAARYAMLRTQALNTVETKDLLEQLLGE